MQLCRKDRTSGLLNQSSSPPLMFLSPLGERLGEGVLKVRATPSPSLSPKGERSMRGHLLRRLEEGFDVGRRVERQAGHVLVNAFHQAREHLAGTPFDQPPDSLRLHLLPPLPPPPPPLPLLHPPLLI